MKTTITDNRNTVDIMIPDRDECMRILLEYGTPEHVIGHCKAVAAVGYAVGKAINLRRSDAITESKPLSLDPITESNPLSLDLILAAGLLHDMARVEDRHWDVAADFCKEKGWVKMADIIRVHMNYDPFNRAEDFNETDVVCLADRVVIEDRYAGLEPRMDYIINKAIRNGHEDYVPHIERKKKDVGKLIGDLEEFIGRSLDSLMEGLDYDHPEIG